MKVLWLLGILTVLRAGEFAYGAGTLKLGGGPSDERNVKYPTKCETCKFLTIELAERFTETGKTHEVLETAPGKRTKYKESEVRFIDTMTDLCERILEYKIQQDKADQGALRFQKKQTETMRSIRQIQAQNPGLNVDINDKMPEEMWELPTVEINRMKQYCEDIIGEYEDQLEDWYKRAKPQGGNTEITRQKLQNFLCVDRVLRREDKSCLNEKKKPNKKSTKSKNEKEKPSGPKNAETIPPKLAKDKSKEDGMPGGEQAKMQSAEEKKKGKIRAADFKHNGDEL